MVKFTLLFSQTYKGRNFTKGQGFSSPLLFLRLPARNIFKLSAHSDTTQQELVSSFIEHTFLHSYSCLSPMASPSSRYLTNAENVSETHTVSRRHNTNARRQRNRFQYAVLRTSRRHAAREASRRMSHVTPAIPRSRTFGLSQDVDMVEPSTQMPSGHYSALPRELRRPTFRPISSAAMAAIDPCLADIPATFVRHQLHNQRKEYVITPDFSCRTSSLTRHRLGYLLTSPKQ